MALVRDYVLLGLIHPTRRTVSGYGIYDESACSGCFYSGLFECDIGLDDLGQLCPALNSGNRVQTMLCIEFLRDRAVHNAHLPASKSSWPRWQTMLHNRTTLMCGLTAGIEHVLLLLCSRRGAVLGARRLIFRLTEPAFAVGPASAELCQADHETSLARRRLLHHFCCQARLANISSSGVWNRWLA